MEYAVVMWRRKEGDKFERTDLVGPPIGGGHGSWSEWIRMNYRNPGQVLLVTDVSAYMYDVVEQTPPVTVSRG